MKLYLVTLLLLLSGSVLAQDQLTYQSKNLPRTDTTWVFKPKNYKKLEKLPIIFLLHGYSGNYKQWNNIMDAQKYADEYGFIIVCPDGLFSSWYLNSPVKSDWQFENFFFDELYPDMKKRYKVDEQHIFITGLSMGGHGAFNLFIKRPELFTSAGSTSGGIKLSDGFGKFGLGDLLGNPPADSELWKKFSVFENIDKLKGNPKPIIFDCGSSDFFYVSNNQLKEKCDLLKLNATYTSQPGAHNKAYWAKSIKQQFTFFKNQVNP
ncbi:esterase family protein [Pedobacter polaris]|uniref:Esterase family protein n=1 Tax=Pedobacter polaris TaxID=2571273 RepID=A0A4U1CV03_9SPHI|nr:alpha/beta hydrolase family protein [Pedobacter polaris]TKC12633.1 esterase family protein [Pedobacter polaris]